VFGKKVACCGLQVKKPKPGMMEGWKVGIMKN
jgi:hypothetical protein